MPNTRTSSAKKRGSSTPDSAAKKKLKFSPEQQQRQDADEDTVVFPDVGDSSSIQRVYKVQEIKSMLSSVGAGTDGTKDVLARRVVDLAHVDDLESISPGSVGQLSDLQVLYALQGLGALTHPDAKRRREELARVVGLAKPDSSGLSSESAPQQPGPSSNSAEASPEDQIARLQAELNTLRAGVSSSAQPDVLLTGHTPPPPPPSTSTAVQPVDTTHLVSAMASAITHAIQDGLGSAEGTGTTETVSSTSESRIVARLRKMHPSTVDPRHHDNDAHKLGLLVQRMIVISFDSAFGLAAMTWKRSCDERIATIHQAIHVDASAASYAEGEARFFAFVSEMVTMAAQFDSDASRYAARRQQQLLWWMQAWEDIRQNLRDATRFWKDPVKTYRLQMEDLITTALGVGLSTSQLRNLQTSCKLRDEFRGDRPSGGGAGSSSSTPSRTPAVGNTPAATPNAPRKPTESSATTRPAKSKCGVLTPRARAIVGADAVDAEAVESTCWSCGKPPPKDGDGHRSWECPARFAKEHPGRRMPGFDSSGSKIPSAWDGDNITSETKRQWERMKALGFFNERAAGAAREA